MIYSFLIKLYFITIWPYYISSWILKIGTIVINSRIITEVENMKLKGIVYAWNLATVFNL